MARKNKSSAQCMTEKDEGKKTVRLKAYLIFKVRGAVFGSN